MQAIGMVSPAQRPQLDSPDLGKDRGIVARRGLIYIYHCESRWVGWRNQSIFGHFPPIPTWSWWEILSEFAASSTIIGTIIWIAGYRTKKGSRLSSVIFLIHWITNIAPLSLCIGVPYYSGWQPIKLCVDRQAEFCMHTPTQQECTLVDSEAINAYQVPPS